MSFLGVATFALNQTATPYSVSGSTGAYTVAGTPFRCRLASLLARSSRELTSQERAELIDRRLLMVAPDVDLSADLQLEVAGQRWNLESLLDSVLGVAGEVEYQRCHVVRAL